MTTAVPNKELLITEGVKTIVLAGQEWPVVRLAVKQIKEVAPRLSRVMSVIQKADTPAIGAVTLLDSASLKDLTEAIFHAVKRGCPALKFEDFDGMDIGLDEMFDAMQPIMEQMGMKLKDKKEGDSGAGEA